MLLILGLVLLISGAHFFVDGASAIAKKLKISTIIIGLTVVAIGTSLPELAISITSAIKGSVDISIGNIVGSNMFNLFVIIGITACINPIVIKHSSKKFDFPLMIIVTLILLVFSSNSFLEGKGNNVITRIEGIILLIIFILYIITNIRMANRERLLYDNHQNALVNSSNKHPKHLNVFLIIIYLIFGVAGVVFGGECVSTSAQFLAAKAGMSQALIGITIVALGTSLPELATAIVAARKGENDLALGNILGSNILNIILIVGTVATIAPIYISNLILIDLIILCVFTIIFSLLAFRKNRIGRLEGVIFVLMYVLYLTFAIVRNYCF